MEDFKIFKQISFRPGHKLKLLDLGCGDCQFLFDFYSFYNQSFYKINAVDSGKDFGRTEDLESGEDLFKKYEGNCEIVDKKNLTPGIMYYHKSEVSDFLKTNGLSYDIILMKNFLHCLDNKTEAISVIQNCIPRLSKNGFLYIQIATPSFAEKKAGSEFGPKWGCLLNEVIEWCKPLNLEHSFTTDKKWHHLLFHNVA